MLLDGKVILVTGSSRGIGRAVAIRAASAGAKVLVNYLSSEDAAGEVVATIRAGGGEAFPLRADVSDAGQVESMVEEIVRRYGTVDILVNNAGVTRDALLVRMKEADWDKVVGSNLKSVYNCTKAVCRLMMKQRWGRIINISSTVGLHGNAGQANYAASKAGIIGFTKSIAKELAPRGITVNAVAPGFIETDMTAVLGEDVKASYLSRIPLGRFGTPDDVAHVVVFLASDGASYITGQTVAIDGGLAS
ncbi:MAG: 3-oxoacyl-[acyl-carrier-protein] reductase [Bacillota bacterium]|jgi:3-oxoacyl-[acyl-carrier protein] reductase|nr:3-oxoacyl-[acyl-carrier-protein] reductase [Bacillota bacterium]